jgi:hypothetical protein
MDTSASASCRRTSCANVIPRSLLGEQLCLDHFLDEAFLRTDRALERCHSGQAIDSAALELLLADALQIVNNLDEEVAPPEAEPRKSDFRTDDQRDRMLELLLILANLHEFVARGAARVIRPA